MVDENRSCMQLDKANQAQLVFAANGQSEETKLSEFKVTHLIGQGAYGKVYLGWLPDKEEAYAIKSIRKDRLVKKQAIPLAFMECEILKNADHQNLTKMEFFF